ncbi:hypothetical protein AWB81_06409 [Caballeronia arationis]|uniref:hypothetical protein n=1 Tax=Caballeronia arationis TaxID=1777142 RepID=UPI00074BAF08|nr:hypothetical protein [Caballeronia arationis]SAL03421.1 hypothetical protein AWB81_06409 [Caballeronia arationis]
MEIFRLENYREQDLMVDIIRDLGKRNLPNIGVFESDKLRLRKKPVTSLAISPENLHAMVSVDAKTGATHLYFRGVPDYKPELLDFGSYTMIPDTPHDLVVKGASALIARFFFHTRNWFNDPRFVQQWDELIYPDFRDSDAGAASYLAHLANLRAVRDAAAIEALAKASDATETTACPSA